MSAPKHPDVPTPAGVANVGDWRPMPARSGWFRWAQSPVDALSR
jgi:hypothetical protein